MNYFTISVRSHIFPETLFTHCIHDILAHQKYISERNSQQEGEPCFLNSEMPTIFPPLQLALSPEPASRAGDAQKAAQ